MPGMYNQVEVGKRLKELRLQKGYTQEEIASKLNVSRQAVSRWETGSSYPDTDKLMLLGEIYGVSVNELLGREKTETEQAESQGTASKKIRFNGEYLSLIVVLAVSVIAPIVGAVVSIAVLVWLIKRKKIYKFVIIVSIICLLIDFYNLYIIYGPAEGTTTIEKID